MTLSLHKSTRRRKRRKKEGEIFKEEEKKKKKQGQEKYKIYHYIIRISRRPNKGRRFSLSYRPERIISAAQIAELEF